MVAETFKKIFEKVLTPNNEICYIIKVAVLSERTAEKKVY